MATIQDPTNEKAWYLSKTLWFNIVMFILSIVSVAQQAPLFQNKVELLTILGSVQTVGNLVLRLLSTQTLTR